MSPTATGGTRRWSPTRTCSRSTAAVSWRTSATGSGRFGFGLAPRRPRGSTSHEVAEARQDLRPRHARPARPVRRLAQSPQALVFDDLVRIYFSTRMVDAGPTGKYRSHVLFADFTQALEPRPRRRRRARDRSGGTRVLRRARDLSHERRPGGRRALRLHDCGWSRARLGLRRDGHRALPSAATAAGASIEPATVRALGHDPRAVSGRRRHSVRVIGDVCTCGTSSERPGSARRGREPERTYKIGHATSPDGMDWTERGRGVQIIAGRPRRRRVPRRFRPSWRSTARSTCSSATASRTDFRTNPGAATASATQCRADLRLLGPGGRRADRSRSTTATGTRTCSATRMPYEHDGQVYLLYNGNEFGRSGFGAAVLER